MKRNDVVYFEWASDSLAYASRLAKSCGIVARLHRYEMYQWVHAIDWAFVDRVILLTNAMQRKFAAQCPDSAHKTIVIPWAISPQRFPLKTTQFVGNIGILGDLIPRKRVYELILAFSELAK